MFLEVKWKVKKNSRDKSGAIKGARLRSLCTQT